MSLEPLAAPTLMLDTALYDGQEILTLKPFKANYHPIDWSQAKTKWPAVIMKEGEGLGVDPLFQEQFRAAEGHVWRGIYHYFVGDVNAIKAAHTAADAIEQAGGYGELGVFLDLEKNKAGLSGGDYLARAASWLFEMEKRIKAFGTDVTLGIYTRASFWDPLFEQAENTGWVAKYPAWVARYSFDGKEIFDRIYKGILDGSKFPERPILPKGFRTIFAWQWTEKGRPASIPGYPPFKKSVDMNLLFFGPSSKPQTRPVPQPPTEGDVAARLDELNRLEAAMQEFFKKRRDELA